MHVADDLKSGVNKDLYADLQGSLQRITDHPLFNGVQVLEALDISADSSASVEPFSEDTWRRVKAGAIAKGFKPTYTAGGNIFWIDPYLSLVPGIPVNRKSILKLQSSSFKTPQLAFEKRRAVHVGILEGEEVLNMRGKLRLLSPDEELYAFIFQLDNVLASEPGEPELEQWLALAKSWTMTVELVPSLTDMYWRCINLREDIGTSFDVFYRSCIQRAYEVIQFKLDYERRNPNDVLSAAGVYQKWVANVQFSTMATGERAFRQSFVDSCLTVYNRILCIEELQKIILQGEEKNGKDNVWLSIYQLEEVCKKCGQGPGSKEKLIWCISGIQDQTENDMLQISSCTTRNLKGQGLPSNKGTVDLFIFKLGFKNLAVSTWLEDAGSAVPPEERQTLRKAFDSFAEYRQHFGCHDERDTVDLSWLARFTPTTREYITFVEDCVFAKKHDRKLKCALSAGAKPVDLPDREEFSVDFKAFKAGWQKERGDAPEPKPELSEALTGTEESIQVGQIIQASMMGGRLNAWQTKDLAKAQHDQALLAKHLKSLSEDEIGLIKDLETKASRIVRAAVKIIVEPERQAVLQEELKSSPIGSRVASKDFLTLVLYDQKTAGESITCPHLRVPPLKVERVKTAIQATCNFLSSGAELPFNGIFAITDAGKTGNERAILNCFVNEAGASMAKHHKSLYVAYKESDLAARLEKFKSTAQLNQLETVHIVTSSAASKQKRRPRRAGHLKGETSSGNILTGVPLPDASAAWSESVVTKKAIFGNQMRIAVGGQTDGEPLYNKDDDQEPVFWHMSSPVLLEELLRSECWADALLDWTPTDVAAKKAMDLGIPYVAVAYTETHKELLMKRLATMVAKDMLTEGHSLYCAEVAKILEVPGMAKKPLPKAKAAAATTPPNPSPADSSQNKRKATAEPESADDDKNDSTHAKLRARLQELSGKK
ncbi:unnamed protein product [Symbiodinium sp. CCMP2592]|nr:unnamed protein product [Symbiodinium sp. CCMP2592]